MAETLYRKYRPQRFADLVDQQHVRLTLQNALQHDRVAHAYLFAGPRGTGKTTVARLLARALNCQNRGKDGEPCNTCATCVAMLKNSALDIVEVDAASQTGVDNVRDNIIQSARSSPSLGKYKVFIIDEVHMLSLAAFNALLKLLEEPPAHAVFVLATTEVHRVPETIISRTQRFDFRKIGLADMVNRLKTIARAEKRKLDPAVAERMARSAGGSLRDAESMLGQLFSFGQDDITAELADVVLPRSDQATVTGLIETVARSQAKEALDIFHRFCDDGGDIARLAHDLVLTSRALMMLSLDGQLLSAVMDDIDQPTAQTLLSLGQEIGLERATVMVETWLKAEQEVQRSTFEELPIEIAIVQLCLDQTPRHPTQVAMPTSTTQSTISSAPPAAPTPTKKKARSQSSLSLAEAQAAWKKLQSSIGRTHPSLSLSIQHANVSRAQDGIITLTVPFQLHIDRLTDPKHHLVLLTAVRDSLGQNINIEIVRGETQSESLPVTPAPALAPVAKAKTPSGDLWDQVVTSFN